MPYQRFDTHQKEKMKIEIWSDVVCPWCYIGKRRFEQALNSGRHLLVIDVNSHEQNLLNRVTAHYPELEFSGTGDGAPNWFIGLQNKWRNFVEVMP